MWNRLLSLVALASCFTTLHAQEAPCTPGVPLGGSASSSVLLDKPEPYSATIRYSYERQLIGGITIRGTAVLHRYLDSRNRMRSESIQQCFVGTDNQLHVVTYVTVSDPNQQTSLSWAVGQPGNTIAYLHHDRVAVVSPQPLRTAASAELRAFEKLRRHTLEQEKPEDLGTRMFFGIEAKGIRIRQIIPAGTEGNNAPLTITTECWTTHHPHLTMLSMRDDQRSGKRTEELIEFTAGEPDPSVFTPPSNYQIEEDKVESVIIPNPAKQ